ncbi:MAG: hypothetical protein AB7S99_08380 [Pseudodonghicola sp.]
MLTQIKTAVSANRETLLQDAMGVLALVVMLVVGLHLPGLI